MRTAIASTAGDAAENQYATPATQCTEPGCKDRAYGNTVLYQGLRGSALRRPARAKKGIRCGRRWSNAKAAPPMQALRRSCSPSRLVWRWCMGGDQCFEHLGKTLDRAAGAQTLECDASALEQQKQFISQELGIAQSRSSA
jgi:hypothetical protein